jgi:glycosyltransferase involved in cell wall biosynthesis
VWDEPFGLVGIEAMAHARAVLAFQGGGVPQWLDHDSTGRMVPRADTNALARELDALMAQPQLRLRMGRAGAARVEQRFRAPEHVERLERVLAAS